MRFWFHRSERCAVIVGNDSGDQDESRISPEVCCISLERQDDVRSLDAIPTRVRYESAACVPASGNEVYVTGVGADRKETWKWQPGGGWTRCAGMIQGRRRHCATFVNQSMYVLGGMIGRPEEEEERILDSIEEYNTETNSWTTVGRLKYPICYATCVVHNNSIYVFGGRHQLDKKCLSSVQVFDTVSRETAELRERLPRCMQMLRSVKRGRFVVIIGKWNCVLFDLEKRKFQQRDQFAAKVHQFGLALENERVFLVGGHAKMRDARGGVTRPVTDDVKSVALADILDNKDANWTRHATLPQPAFIHAFAVMTLPK